MDLLLESTFTSYRDEVNATLQSIDDGTLSLTDFISYSPTLTHSTVQALIVLAQRHFDAVIIRLVSLYNANDRFTDHRRIIVLRTLLESAMHIRASANDSLSANVISYLIHSAMHFNVTYAPPPRPPKNHLNSFFSRIIGIGGTAAAEMKRRKRLKRTDDETEKRRRENAEEATMSADDKRTLIHIELQSLWAAVLGWLSRQFDRTDEIVQTVMPHVAATYTAYAPVQSPHQTSALHTVSAVTHLPVLPPIPIPTAAHPTNVIISLLRSLCMLKLDISTATSLGCATTVISALHTLFTSRKQTGEMKREIASAISALLLPLSDSVWSESLSYRTWFLLTAELYTTVRTWIIHAEKPKNWIVAAPFIVSALCVADHETFIKYFTDTLTLLLRCYYYHHSTHHIIKNNHDTSEELKDVSITAVQHLLNIYIIKRSSRPETTLTNLEKVQTAFLRAPHNRCDWMKERSTQDGLVALILIAARADPDFAAHEMILPMIEQDDDSQDNSKTNNNNNNNNNNTQNNNNNNKRTTISGRVITALRALTMILGVDERIDTVTAADDDPNNKSTILSHRSLQPTLTRLRTALQLTPTFHNQHAENGQTDFKQRIEKAVAYCLAQSAHIIETAASATAAVVMSDNGILTLSALTLVLQVVTVIWPVSIPMVSVVSIIVRSALHHDGLVRRYGRRLLTLVMQRKTAHDHAQIKPQIQRGVVIMNVIEHLITAPIHSTDNISDSNGVADILILLKTLFDEWTHIDGVNVADLLLEGMNVNRIESAIAFRLCNLSPDVRLAAINALSALRSLCRRLSPATAAGTSVDNQSHLIDIFTSCHSCISNLDRIHDDSVISHRSCNQSASQSLHQHSSAESDDHRDTFTSENGAADSKDDRTISSTEDEDLAARVVQLPPLKWAAVIAHWMRSARTHTKTFPQSHVSNTLTSLSAMLDERLTLYSSQLARVKKLKAKSNAARVLEKVGLHLNELNLWRIMAVCNSATASHSANILSRHITFTSSPFDPIRLIAANALGNFDIHHASDILSSLVTNSHSASLPMHQRIAIAHAIRNISEQMLTASNNLISPLIEWINATSTHIQTVADDHLDLITHFSIATERVALVIADSPMCGMLSSAMRRDIFQMLQNKTSLHEIAADDHRRRACQSASIRGMCALLKSPCFDTSLTATADMLHVRSFTLEWLNALLLTDHSAMRDAGYKALEWMLISNVTLIPSFIALAFHSDDALARRHFMLIAQLILLDAKTQRTIVDSEHNVSVERTSSSSSAATTSSSLSPFNIPLSSLLHLIIYGLGDSSYNVRSMALRLVPIIEHRCAPLMSREPPPLSVVVGSNLSDTYEAIQQDMSKRIAQSFPLLCAELILEAAKRIQVSHNETRRMQMISYAAAFCNHVTLTAADEYTSNNGDGNGVGDDYLASDQSLNDESERTATSQQQSRISTNDCERLCRADIVTQNALLTALMTLTDLFTDANVTALWMALCRERGNVIAVVAFLIQTMSDSRAELTTNSIATQFGASKRIALYCSRANPRVAVWKLVHYIFTGDKKPTTQNPNKQ